MQNSKFKRFIPAKAGIYCSRSLSRAEMWSFIGVEMTMTRWWLRVRSAIFDSCSCFCRCRLFPCEI